MAAILRIAACFFVLAVLLPEATLGLKCFDSTRNGKRGMAKLTESTPKTLDNCPITPSSCSTSNPLLANKGKTYEEVCVHTVYGTHNYRAFCKEKGYCKEAYNILPEEGANSKYRSGGAWLCTECTSDYCNGQGSGAGHLSLQFLAPVGSLILVLMAKQFI